MLLALAQSLGYYLIHAGNGNIIAQQNTYYILLWKSFQRRIYIPLPDLKGRFLILKRICSEFQNNLTDSDKQELAEKTNGY